MEETEIPLDQFHKYVEELKLEMCKMHMIRLHRTKRNVCPYVCKDRKLNRYSDIIPYQHSRVILTTQEEDNDPDSNYINACHIKPVFSTDTVKYISCCAPTTAAMNHFWRMVWEQGSKVVLMLTREVENGKKKADVYWPDPGTRILRGDVAVETKSQEIEEYIISRKFLITRNGEQREVAQLQYTGWPDYGAPSEYDSVVQFFQKYRTERKSIAGRKEEGPVVVHCSAGVGRSGTFIAADMLLDHLASPNCNGTINIYQLVNALRQSRCQMVQSIDQYDFLNRFVDYCMTTKLFGAEKSIGSKGSKTAENTTNEETVALRRDLSDTQKKLEHALWQNELLAKLVERLEDRYINARVEVAKLTQQLQSQSKPCAEPQIQTDL